MTYRSYTYIVASKKIFKVWKKSFRVSLTIVYIAILSLGGSAQNSYPIDYFRPPLDNRMLLAGTFGEIRANHFHSGIDIKTGGAEGAAVYAIADGYVSRIKVSAYGFGKAIYVTHPNGYVSVYGHLRNYNKTIGDYIRKEQYRRENFEIELFPKPEDFPVKKGEVIAYSGNSGSSGGPHLHFEIREGATEKPINPLLFGYQVKDLIEPVITSIKIYPEDYYSKINGSVKAVRYEVTGTGTEYKISNNPVLKLSGNISFAIQAYDKQSDTDNNNGIYNISLFIDSKEVFSFRLEKFAFDETRYVNSFLDYEEFIKNSVRLQRTKIDPGNKLSLYGPVVNKGVYLFNDTLIHSIRYELTDVAGNKSVLTFKVKSEKHSLTSDLQPPTSDRQLPTADFFYDRPNHFSTASVDLDCPKGVFYRNFVFEYDSAKQMPGTYSLVHKIHNPYTPVHDYINLSIKPVGLPETLRNKALIVKIGKDGKGFSSAGGTWEGQGFVSTKIREFGDYALAVDTVSPRIKAANAENFSNMAGKKYIKLTISDDLSGIASYKGMINGKWILMEYDAKNDLLIYEIDEKLLPGKNTLLVEVRDGKNNRGIYSAIINL